MTVRSLTRLLVLAFSLAALCLPSTASAVVPNFTLSTPADGLHINGSLSVNGNSSNVDIQATCTIPNYAPYFITGDCTYNGRWVSVAYSISSALPEGTYNVTVKATAQDGSGQSTTVTRSIVVDRTGPTITYTSGPRGGQTVTGRDFSWNFTANESGTVQCKFDDEDWADCSSPYVRTNLDDGAHTLRIHSTDNTYPWGNTGGDTVASFTVNNAPPEAIIHEIDSPTSNEAPIWDIDATRPDASVECRMDGGSWTDCTSGYEAQSNLTEGSHTLEARAYLAGPTDIQATPTAQAFIVDLTAPEVHFTTSTTAYPGFDAEFWFGSTATTWITSAVRSTATTQALAPPHSSGAGNGGTTAGTAITRSRSGRPTRPATRARRWPAFSVCTRISRRRRSTPRPIRPSPRQARPSPSVLTPAPSSSAASTAAPTRAARRRGLSRD
ncbi:MAG: Ig-like domain-containing protein [Solirubrobacterales bacterium]